ncbi:hypothetical protein RclHR1_00180050 [Rhizophagus clarus]|uniref:NUDE domain-containing protein n=1 Tax=Rhizophagus clarus TaxID=94130 RepID=A0A2Z6QQH7_9GLOM|nr:hypothetical protein RclHR1_00180050 [Rhizophagus clarus]
MTGKRTLSETQSALEEFQMTSRELEEDLEQIDCDDLERTESRKKSLLDLESKYNKAIERNVILENEVEEKNSLIEQVQRLKDELKDGELGPPTPSSEPVSPQKKEIYNPPAPQPSQKQL